MAIYIYIMKASCFELLIYLLYEHFFFQFQDINDLRLELMRKDDLIKRHYEKITMWQNLLADLQSQGWAKSPAQGPTGMSNGQPPPPQPQPTPGPGAMSTLQMQQQMQQAQQIQHQQQMHQQMQQQMQQQVNKSDLYTCIINCPTCLCIWKPV